MSSYSYMHFSAEPNSATSFPELFEEVQSSSLSSNTSTSDLVVDMFLCALPLMLSIFFQIVNVFPTIGTVQDIAMTALTLLRFLVQQNTALFSTFRPSSVRPSVRHRRDISTFLNILTVYTMKTIYFLNAYHLGW